MHNFQNGDFVVVFTMFSSAGLSWGWSKIKESKTVCASMLNCKSHNIKHFGWNSIKSRTIVSGKSLGTFYYVLIFFITFFYLPLSLIAICFLDEFQDFCLLGWVGVADQPSFGRYANFATHCRSSNKNRFNLPYTQIMLCLSGLILMHDILVLQCHICCPLQDIEIESCKEEVLLSKQWGSFFVHADTCQDKIIDCKLDGHHDLVKTSGRKQINTFWGDLIQKYSTFVIPRLDFITG